MEVMAILEASIYSLSFQELSMVESDSFNKILQVAGQVGGLHLEIPILPE